MSDLIGVVEAVYRPEVSHQAWLQGLSDAVHPLLDDGFGSIAWSIQFSDDVAFLRHFASTGMQPKVLEALLQSSVEERPQTLRACHGKSVNTVRTQLGARYLDSPGYRLIHPLGMEDVLGVVALNPDGTGVGVGVPLRSSRPLQRTFVQRWERVSAHLAAGIRLRRRSCDATPEVDAVLAANGNLKHATAQASQSSNREALRRTAVAIDKARGDNRSRDADAALAAWTALVQGTWTLVDHFDTDGRRYLLARRNMSSEVGPDTLTSRQRQVLALRAGGHSLKLIAYELGFSISTVALDLKKALSLLGLRTVNELGAVSPATGARAIAGL